MKNLIVTGSGGLIGTSVCHYFSKKGFYVYGIDNDMRKRFFGNEASVRRNIDFLKTDLKNYHHYDIDIRDRQRVFELYEKVKPVLTVHCHPALA